MKVWQKYLVAWALAIMFVLGSFAMWLACMTQVEKRVDEILDSKLITTYDKQCLSIMEGICYKTAVDNPRRFWQEIRYYSLWGTGRFAEHNEELETK